MGERLLVYGYFGGRNFGDELMLLGLLAEARALGVDRIRIITPDGRLLPHLAGKVERAYPKSPGGFAAGLAWATAFAICGGTMFHDGFSDSRHRAYRRNLVALAALCTLARALRRRVWLLGVGMGPFRRRSTAAATRRAIAAAHRVTVRDRQSLADLAAIGADMASVALERDLAYSTTLPARLRSDRSHLVISTVPPEITSSVAEGEAVQFRQALGSRLAGWLRTDDARRITILAVAVGRVDHDLDAARRLASALHSSSADRVEIRAFEGDVDAVLDFLAGAGAVIASRYHLGLAAELIGAPTFWLPYQRKVVDAASALDVPPARIGLPHVSTADAIADWLEAIAQPSPARKAAMSAGASAA